MDRCNIAVLGDGGVGKTALAVQNPLTPTLLSVPPQLWFSRGATFPQPVPGALLLMKRMKTYDPTIEDAYLKQVVVENRMCAIDIIDTAGQDDYSVLSNQWIKEAEAFVIVYSVSSQQSFKAVETFWRNIYMQKSCPPPFVLVGNKKDRLSERDVSRDEGAALAKAYGCEFFETSAKTPENIEGPFISLVREVRRRRSQMSELPQLDNELQLDNGPYGRWCARKQCVII
ncbi:hypothetical protein VNI00_018476 [Paramarasmius palmivorus]|uniref:Uncharacterized protein n=1 Tax=Paramarasmius palmivorus TaxID=297713 RepID=A0AAW0AY43_9AGAR